MVMIDISKPRWDQNTFSGRLKHFFTLTNPANILASDSQFKNAYEIITKYRNGQLEPTYKIEDVWRAKYLYDSAHHPETGQRQYLIGRMSFQVPGNLIITCGMLTFYKSKGAIIFWQWLNQSFNATVNYTNRSGGSNLTNQGLLTAYLSATSCAVVTALGLNSLTKKLPPIFTKLVPFCAVAAANCVNIPLMRQSELLDGIPLLDSNGNMICSSKNAAFNAITMVVFSRICMAMPGLVIPPLFSSFLEKKEIFKKTPKLLFPLNVGIIGLCIAVATPICCAIFPQYSEIKVGELEETVKYEANSRGFKDNMSLIFNKGL